MSALENDRSLSACLGLQRFYVNHLNLQTVTDQANTPAPDATCDKCGALQSQPNGPHTKRKCEECGKERFGVPGPDGLKTEKGDTVVIPAGHLSMSLDPTQTTGRLFRPGITWLVNQQFFANSAQNVEDIPDCLQAYVDMADHALESSEMLADLNLDSEEGINAAIDRAEDTRTPEFWALRLGIRAERCKRNLADGEAAEAVVAMQQAAIARCMLIFVRSIEELVWRGYRTFGVSELEAAIDLWEKSSGDEPESFWQQILSEHNFVLSQLFSAPAIVIEDQPYVGGKEVTNMGGSLADFLLQNSLTQTVTIVEIKTPKSKLLLANEYRTGVYAPSAELSGAAAQAQSHRDTLTKEFYNLTKGRAEFFPYDPLCVVIVGDTAQIESDKQRKSFELFRRGLKDVQVVTFDEVFGQARALLELIRRYPKAEEQTAEDE